jgi:hypothetical protein
MSQLIEHSGPEVGLWDTSLPLCHGTSSKPVSGQFQECQLELFGSVNTTPLRETYPQKIDSSYECRANSHAAEHFDERSGGSLGGARSGLSELAHQALLVHGAQLIQSYLSVFPLKAYRHSRRIGSHNRGHRCDNHSPQMLVHFIRGYNEARASLLDLYSLGRIQTYQPDLIASGRASYHCHSSWSNLLGPAVPSRSSS